MADQAVVTRWQAIALATEYARRHEPRFHTGLFVPEEWVIQLIVETVGEEVLKEVWRQRDVAEPLVTRRQASEETQAGKGIQNENDSEVGDWRATAGGRAGSAGSK